MNFFLVLTDFLSNEFFAKQFFGITLLQYVLFFLAIILALAVGKVIGYLVKQYGKMLAEKTENKLDDVIISIIGKTIIFFSLLAGLFIGFQFLHIQDSFINSIVIEVISALVLVIIMWILLKIIDEVVEQLLVPFAKKSQSELDDQLVPLLRKASKVFVVVLFAIMILSSFGYDVTAIIAGLGIGGLAIAFAAQETIKDIFGGVSIFTSRPFKIGDQVLFNNELLKVEEVGLRYTRLRNLDDRQVIIPNSQVASAVLTNVTSSKKKKMRVSIGLTYDTPAAKIKKAKELIAEVINSTKACDKNPEIYFREFKESSLDFLLIYIIKDLDKWMATADEVNTRIKEEFDKAGIEFAFPTQTVYLKK